MSLSSLQAHGSEKQSTNTMVSTRAETGEPRKPSPWRLDVRLIPEGADKREKGGQAAVSP